MRIGIIVRFAFEGIHSWPGAPEGRERYLASPHRHLFHVEAVKLVKHADRDIEFIELKRQMQLCCEVRYGREHTFSCEAIALELTKEFGLRTCRVLEDNENGAEVSVD